ncbi:MAG: sel1 repeat family protein [Campylobacter sp.]|nr:sel1 repeat family protein [Campylobacter sp.]
MRSFIFVIFAAFVLTGCVTASNKNTISNQRIEDEVVLIGNVNASVDTNQLNKTDVAGAFSIANNYYQNGDFVNAIAAYDYTCTRFQYVPACVRMANMFEKGEGVVASKMAALDIYQRACYSGHKDSCNDVKRLQ